MPSGRPPNPDRLQQNKRNVFHRQKAQAKYRGETWNIDFEQWWGLWETYWDLRGRRPSDYCMRQLDTQLGWEMPNLEICERSVFFREQPKRNRAR
tara:strand:+ start:4211 stop:4495 length:285 start_codon:yes stop_codon:yes gene_type:complete